MKIALGCDHGGYALKEQIKTWLEEMGHEYADFGCYSTASCDYPEFGAAAAKAVAAGDKNVYFIDGADYFAGLEDWATATVDGCHPNDLGFYLMYQRVLPVLKQALGL